MNEKIFNKEIEEKPVPQKLEAVLIDIEEDIKEIKSKIKTLKQEDKSAAVEEQETLLAEKESQKKKITWELVKDNPVFKN